MIEISELTLERRTRRRDTDSKETAEQRNR
jgi:hypothetical protein